MNLQDIQRNRLNRIATMATESMSREDFIKFTQENLDCLDYHEFKQCVANTDHKDLIKSNETVGLDIVYRDIVQWAKDRKIIPNGNPMTQAIKTLEEVHELIRAIDRKDPDEITDAYGDIFVTIVNGAYLHGVQLPDCAHKAFKVIEHRTGTLNEQGDFIKD